MNALRGLIAGAAAFVAAAPSFADTAPTQIEIQSQFVQAIAAINAHEYPRAEKILRQLYAVAPTPRIRLELARTLALANRRKEALALFHQALADRPPAAVRATIMTFINQLNRSNGYVHFSVAAGKFHNPLQQPDPFTFDFHGLALHYVPDEQLRNVWGLTYSADAAKSLGPKDSVDASVSFRNLPRSEADRLVIDASWTHTFGRSLMARVGLLHFGQFQQTYDAPYMEVVAAKPLSSAIQLRPDVRVSYQISGFSSKLSAWNADAFFALTSTPKPNKFYALGLTYQRHSAGLAEQSYSSAGLRGILDIKGKTIDVNASAQLRLTKFDAADPFWGITRSDRSAFAVANVILNHVHIRKLHPMASVSCDSTHSNIAFFRSSGCDVSLGIHSDL
ncbi:MAG: DUF2860 family protein [Sphingomonadales bacterium]|nr:DUF2860 family protein [Sphingomonadales bacterium]